MPEFVFTLIDEETRRITGVESWPGLLQVASHNPSTIKGFGEKYAEFSGDQLYLEQRLDPVEEVGIEKSGLIPLLATRRLPEKLLENLTRGELIRLAKKPNYQDVDPDARRGLGLRPNLKGLRYDGVIAIDLRYKEVLILGHLDKTTKALPKSGNAAEPYYQQFGFLSDIRTGFANGVKYGNPSFRKYAYALDRDWQIINLKTGGKY